MSGTGMGSSFFILVEIRFIHGYIVVEGRDLETFNQHSREVHPFPYREWLLFMFQLVFFFVPVSYSWICSFFVHCKKQRDCHITMGDKRCNNPLHFQLQSGCRRDNFEISSFQYGNKICEAVTKRNQRHR